ncbi:MAG: BACON domain-containing protein [Planctomycetes bacterium]|nr:BACON domain-containing protein [Planctomycetota bacterium]
MASRYLALFFIIPLTLSLCSILFGDAPAVLVPDGVRSYDLHEPKVFWHTAANCFPGGGEFPPTNTDKPEVLSRIATSGGLVRELLNENPVRPANICNPYHFFADIAAGAVAVQVMQVSDGKVLASYSISAHAPVGENTIVLTATNSLGLSAATQIKVIVNDDLSVPGPTLAVAPAKVSWHVPAGAAGLLDAAVNIANIGAGALQWTASENADWLTLSAAQGTAPDDLVLTANPNGIADGTALSTQVAIQGPNGQSAAVLVTLAVGTVFNSDAETIPAKPKFIRGDCNGDGDISGVTDAITLLTANFLGGVTIPEPYPVCGESARPSDAILGCDAPPETCAH